jgi:lipopolysaccharide biosynthesis glycosyltransferase
MKYLLYQAYGNIAIIQEALYSILSFYRIHPDAADVTVVVYTDNEEPFKELFSNQQVECVLISHEQIKEWKGEINFVHRLKIKVLQDFFERYHGDVLYLDSDTCFTKNILLLWQAIEKGKLIMHMREGKVSDKINPVFKKLAHFLSSNAINLKTGEQIKISASTDMWNAGVLGLKPEHKHILDQVLMLTDSMYPVYPKHIVEQFAFSYYFQQHAEVLAAEDCIYHYWNFKEFRSVLADFFAHNQGKSLNVMLDKMQNIQPMELSKAKMEFESLGQITKFFRKLKVKNGWQMPAYKL